MKKNKKIKTHQYDEHIENALINLVVTQEYEQSKDNRMPDNNDYEAFLDLFNCERSEKNYDWMSDHFVPEFLSQMMTQLGIGASQYFKTRDFVQVYVASEKDEDLQAAEANKTLINRTLNQKYLNYYQKFIRALAINNIGGAVYFRCWWEQKLKLGVVRHEQQVERLPIDIDGNPILDETQIPAQKVTNVPVIGTIPVIDRFNFDIIDPRDIFCSEEYTYTLQEKKYVILRFDTTIDDLEQNHDEMNYFNLDILKNAHIRNDNSESKGSYNVPYYTRDKRQESESTPIKNWTILERYGKYWVKVTKRDEDDNPLEIEPGVDDQGQVLENAELHETIMSFAISDMNKVLIRFQLNPYKDAEGNSYKPIIKGLCYIHPTVDYGFGDGKSVRELQVALNDTINMSNDRVKLATIPVMKGNKYSLEDNESVYFEPGHVIRLEHTTDLEQLVIQDNISAALQQASFFVDKMQQVTATYPTTMGSLPALASTTATAVAGSEARTDTRGNFRSLTLENTLLVEFYWMITQMTWQFAHGNTAEKLLGKHVHDFNPRLEYTYKPVTDAIETETSKRAKVQNWITIMGYLTSIPNPNTAKVINYVLQNIFQLMGAEYVNFADKFLNENVPIVGKGQEQSMNPAVPASNQSGVPQSAMEQQARNVVGAR